MVAQELVAKFEIRNFGLSVDGLFRDTEIEYKFDTSSLSSSYFKAGIRVKSIDTGIKNRDQHLLEEKYFHVEKFPVMTFNSTSMVKKDLGFLLTGQLTIKGVSKTIETPLELVLNKKGVTELKTDFTIDRRDFDVGKGSLVLGDEVVIRLSLKVNFNLLF